MALSLGTASNPPETVLFLSLGTVGASLGKRPQFEVVSLSPPFPTVQELGAMEPEVILFDLEADRPEAAFALLENRPGLLLIGFSPDSNQAKMWTGRQLRELSTEDLVQAITDIEFRLSDSREREARKPSL